MQKTRLLTESPMSEAEKVEQEKRLQRKRAVLARFAKQDQRLWPPSRGDPLPFYSKMLRITSAKRLEDAADTWREYGALGPFALFLIPRPKIPRKIPPEPPPPPVIEPPPKIDWGNSPIINRKLAMVFHSIPELDSDEATPRSSGSPPSSSDWSSVGRADAEALEMLDGMMGTGEPLTAASLRKVLDKDSNE